MQAFAADGGGGCTVITRFSGHSVSSWPPAKSQACIPLGRNRDGSCDQYCDGRSGGSWRISGRSPLCNVTRQRRNCICGCVSRNTVLKHKHFDFSDCAMLYSIYTQCTVLKVVEVFDLSNVDGPARAWRDAFRKFDSRDCE